MKLIPYSSFLALDKGDNNGRGAHKGCADFSKIQLDRGMAY